MDKPFQPRPRAKSSWRQIVRRARTSSLDARRGHAVCDAWLDAETGFDTFVRDVGLPDRPGLRLSRRWRDQPWGPGNAFWIDNHRLTRYQPELFVVAFGECLPLMRWVDISGQSRYRLYHRIFSHYWLPEKAISTPRMHRGRNARRDLFS